MELLERRHALGTELLEPLQEEACTAPSGAGGRLSKLPLATQGYRHGEQEGGSRLAAAD